MADVFISYARADKARVAPLVAAIEAKGWSVWWDPAMSPGQEFDDEIHLELQAAKAVLVSCYTAVQDAATRRAAEKIHPFVHIATTLLRTGVDHTLRYDRWPTYHAYEGAFIWPLTTYLNRH